MQQFRLRVIPVLRAFGPIILAVLYASVSQAQSSSSGTEIRNSPDSFSVSRYVVEGVVKDDTDAPVEGAALHIGRSVAYTNSSGRFFVRCAKREPMSFSVASEAFVNNGVYAVISAPTQVQSQPEENAAEVRVVVRRIPLQPQLYPQ